VSQVWRGINMKSGPQFRIPGFYFLIAFTQYLFDSLAAQIAVPLSGSCSQIKQGCAGCCPDRKQNQSCPCRRDSSRREPWSRFALGLLFARFAWFERSFDPLQVPIECDHLRS
jgi:hypothetical protein